MNNIDLNSKWELVSNSRKIKGFQALRISSVCIPDIYIGIDEKGCRNFILFLPVQLSQNIVGTQKEKLSLEYQNKNNVILVRLNDFRYYDLFDDLILSLYSKIEELSDPNVYTSELISSFYKWSEFFDDKRNFKLSNPEIAGLYGELFVLKRLLSQESELDVNEILEAWKGPYDTTNDFVFDSKNIEVKTKKDSESTVRISSEHQLECEFDKGLELVVVSIVEELLKGKSLYDLVTDIITHVRSNFGNLSIFYHALLQKGLTTDSVKEYNNHRFRVSKTSSFDCGNSGFPKLTKTNIPEELVQLSYKLRITTLDEFLIEEKQY